MSNLSRQIAEIVTNLPDTNGTDLPEEPAVEEGVVIFLIFCAFFGIIVGTTGNALTLLAIWRNPCLRSQAATVFVISLVISDLLYCALVLPFHVKFLLNDSWATEDDSSCAVFLYFNYSNIGVSILSLVAITINRFVMIVYQSHYVRIYTPVNTAIMLVSLWLFNYALMSLPLSGVWGAIHKDPESTLCTISEGSHGENPKNTLHIIFFVLPCLAIVVCYSQIYWKVRQSRRKITAHRPTIVGEASLPTPNHRRDQELRLTRMIFIIFFCFLVCFSPALCVAIADPTGDKWPNVHLLTYVPAWFSSVINPFIYALSNTQYRQAYKNILCGTCCSRTSTVSIVTQEFSRQISNSNRSQS